MDTTNYKNFSYYNDKGLAGLVNIGNTCYLNSVIQCLAHTMELTHYIVSKKFSEEINASNEKRREYSLFIRYAEVLSGIWKENTTINPRVFKQVLEFFSPRFRGNNQHDAHECLTFILDILHKSICLPVEMKISGVVETEFDIIKKLSVETYKNNFEGNYSWFIRNMYSQMHTIIQCPDCSFKSHNFDPYSCISLDLPNSKENTTLQKCLESMCLEETLDESNRWKCDNCNTLVCAKKTSSIWDSPNILILNLKRFNNNGLKKENRVEFDINNLNLDDYTSIGQCSKSYELYSVINHSGTSNSGHYWAYCKRGDDWFNFNDSSVSKINTNDIISEANYVLFFRIK